MCRAEPRPFETSAISALPPPKCLGRPRRSDDECPSQVPNLVGHLPGVGAAVEIVDRRCDEVGWVEVVETGYSRARLP